MPPFLTQAKFTTDPQALGDVSNRLSKLGDAVAEGVTKYQEKNKLLELGKAAQSGDLKALQSKAFELGDPRLGLQVNQLLTQQAGQAEDRAFRVQQAERSQLNADRSYGLQEKQFDFNKVVQSQNFQLKMKEIEAKNQKLSNVLSPGQQAADKKFADEYVQFRAAGGFADINKQLNQLEGVAKQLDDIASGRSGDTLTGPWIGNMPDMLKSFTSGGQKALAAQQRVEEVVQRNLRLILGAQFTEKEGSALIKRAYNPALPEGENASRLRGLIAQMRTAAQQKQQASDFFEQNGTIAGFKGQFPGITPQEEAAAQQGPVGAPGLPPLPNGFEIVR